MTSKESRTVLRRGGGSDVSFLADIQGMPLKFLTGNIKGWALTKDGFNVAYGLSEEANPKYPRNKGAFPGQAEHLYGTNQFFISLI